MNKSKKKQWTEEEEMELDHFYSSLHWSFEKLAKHFNCTVKEVRQKLKT